MSAREDKQSEVAAALLVIGDEILSGRVKDQNTGAIAQHLTGIGIRLKEVRVVGDEETLIIAAVNALRCRYDYVFTTGGIGPTHDDITADCIARAFGVGIDIDERAVAMLRQRYSTEDLTPPRLRMARIPAGAELVDNPVSSAPGFMIGNVIVMAGVPRIMQAMLLAVTPRLRKGERLISQTVRVDEREGQVAPLLTAVQAGYPDVMMGSYPSFDAGRFSVQIVLRSTDAKRLQMAKQTLLDRLREAGLRIAYAD